MEETEEERRERDMTRSEAQVRTPGDTRGQDVVLLMFMFQWPGMVQRRGY